MALRAASAVSKMARMRSSCTYRILSAPFFRYERKSKYRVFKRNNIAILLQRTENESSIADFVQWTMAFCFDGDLARQQCCLVEGVTEDGGGRVASCCGGEHCPLACFVLHVVLCYVVLLSVYGVDEVVMFKIEAANLVVTNPLPSHSRKRALYYFQYATNSPWKP